MFSLFHPLMNKIIAKADISKPLAQKISRSLFVLCTAPFSRGSKVSIDKYDGVVQKYDIWYVKLKNKNRTIFLPTSFIYDKIIEVYDWFFYSYLAWSLLFISSEIFFNLVLETGIKSFIIKIRFLLLIDLLFFNIIDLSILQMINKQID